MSRVTDIQDSRDGFIVTLDDQTQIRIRKPLRKSGDDGFDSPSHRITFTQTRRTNDEDIDMTLFDKRSQTQDVLMIRPMHQGQFYTSPEKEEERVVEGPHSFASGEDWMAVARRAKQYRPRPPQTSTNIPYTNDPSVVDNDLYSGGRKRRKTSRLPSKSLRRRQSRRSRKSRGGAKSL
jgi:hypothetical protein